MNTIQECIESTTEFDAGSGPGKQLTDALIAREQEMVGTLHMTASQFGLLPQIVAKVICMIGLGEPCTEEMRAHVDAQYARLMAQIVEQRQQAIEHYASQGISVEIPVFKDPLAADATEMVIPDSPPEA